mgnify:CR=1 FL=1
MPIFPPPPVTGRQQHPQVAILRRRLQEAQAHHDDATVLQLREALSRIEIRELNREQRAAQAAYIADQCFPANRPVGTHTAPERRRASGR